MSNWHCFDMPPQLGIQYVYIRECREMDVDGRKIWVVLAQSVSVPQCPEKPGIVRVKSYKQSLAIESDGKTGSKGKRSRKCYDKSCSQRMFVLAKCTTRETGNFKPKQLL